MAINKRVSSVVFCIVSGFSFSVLVADEIRPNHVFSVGIDNFGLRFSGLDAAGFARSVGTSHSITVVSGNGLATSDKIRSQLKLFAKQVPQNATFIFFFSGHCVQIEEGPTKTAYLVPEINGGELEIEKLLPLSEAKNLINKCDATQKLIILDCCHAGATKGISVRQKNKKAKPLSNEKLKTEFEQIDNCITLASCKSNELSIEDAENRSGLFSKHLIKGLAGYADYDFDGTIDSTELYMFVKTQVEKESKVRFHRNQTPALISEQKEVPTFGISKWGKLEIPINDKRIKTDDFMFTDRGLYFAGQGKASAEVDLIRKFKNIKIEIHFDFTQGENVTFTLGDSQVKVLGLGGQLKIVTLAGGSQQQTRKFKLRGQTMPVRVEIILADGKLEASATNVGKTKPLKAPGSGFDTIGINTNIFANRNLDFALHRIIVSRYNDN